MKHLNSFEKFNEGLFSKNEYDEPAKKILNRIKEIFDINESDENITFGRGNYEKIFK